MMFQTRLQLHGFGDVFVCNHHIDTTIISLVSKVLLELWNMKLFKNFPTPKITCKLYTTFFIVELLDGF